MPKRANKKQPEIVEGSTSFREMLDDYRPFLESVYRSAFLRIPEGRQYATIEDAIVHGFYVKAITGYGNLKALFDPKWGLVEQYKSALRRGDGTKLKPIYGFEDIDRYATEQEKENAEFFCKIYLTEFISALQLELMYVVEGASDLALIKTAKKCGSKDTFKKVIEKMGKETTIRRKRVTGIRRGGSRPRSGFKWDDQKKVAFYKRVSCMPQIKKRSIWEYACGELIEQEFDQETQDWLLSRPGFETVNKDLFREAVKCWRKYDERRDIVDDNDKPRCFEFRQALIDLKFPDTYKYSTLENYFSAGKKQS